MPCNRLISEFTANYMEQLFYFCLKKTGNETEAEDLTQDIALNIITALSKGTIPVNFSAWVWQIARNRYSAWANEKHKRNEFVSASDIWDHEIEDKCPPVLDKILDNEQVSLLRRELAFIKRDYRNIVVAYYIEGRNVQDIARQLSLSVNAVQQRLHRARTILKEGMHMAREFGTLSYRPEDISFIFNGLSGSDGEPWNYLKRSLCKNILLAAYRTPAAAEELAVEVGVALPYMEEELNDLVDATLMKKNSNKYETNFFIVSSAAQKNIVAHLQGIASELTKAIIDALEYEVSWKNKNCPDWHEGYQSYEDMKWALLMCQTDVINFDTLDTFHINCKTGSETSSETGVGTWGHSIRPNGGEWDVLGMEIFKEEHPAFVGLHGCVVSPEERNLPEIYFRQFKFQYCGIENKTLQQVPYAYAQALTAIAKGEGSTINDAILNHLQQHGYIEKNESAYRPTFLVMFKSKEKQMPSKAAENLKLLHHKATDIAMDHYLFCRRQICKEIPEFLKNDEHQIDHACANIFTMRGAVLEEALRQGYLTYAEHDSRRMLGTFLKI